MGRIYDFAKKLQTEGIYTAREAEFFSPGKQDASTFVNESGMAPEQVDDYIKMLMQDAKMRKAKKSEAYDTESF